ncbi:MAG: Holliday junction branch migration protein RuvA [Chitinophagaceae bacterium]
MIAFLHGKLIDKQPTSVCIEVQGVGYEVHISLNTYAQIQALQEGRLLTYLLVREDALTLYGFFEEKERTMFLQLIGVSGIGAGTARMMLSSMKPDELAQAIVNNNEVALEKIKGIGAKSAKRIILELKDKLSKTHTAQQMESLSYNKINEDALNALMSLGIARATAQQAIQKISSQDQDLGLEDMIKLALKNI